MLGGGQFSVGVNIGSPRLISESDTNINARKHEAAVLVFTYEGLAEFPKPAKLPAI